MTLTIAGRQIGPGQPPFVIAELSGNHNGDLDRAMRLIRAAKDCGADAVKFQTYTADTMTIDHHGPGFDITEGPWVGRSLYELYQEAATPWEWHADLFAEARRLDLIPFSSPFDEAAIDLLESLDAPAYKIASFEIVDLSLIERAAKTGKPVIMSTGMASDDEIQRALAVARHHGRWSDVALLHCVSGYPSAPAEANLRRIRRLRKDYRCTIGLSDHGRGIAAPAAAVALGAKIIEKHLCLSVADGGPDAAFSLEREEFASMVRAVRAAWEACRGSGDPVEAPSEAVSRQHRRSLYVVADIKAGERFTAENVRSIRPGFGLPPALLPRVMGAIASIDLTRGTPLDENHLRTA